MTTQKPFHETLDLTIIGNMGRVHRLCREAITLAVEPLGLTQSRWTALTHINMLGEGITQLELAQSLGIEMPSLTRTLKQLEEQLLITRKVDEHDKRSKKIYFTEQGGAILQSLNEKLIDIKSQLYSGLSTQQLDAFAYGIVNMEKNALNCIKE
ncbi:MULTISPECIES: MarR family transcriptional regulator [Pseudoalteromonas]|uniref:MarR family transcriptional regulator n=1 Tax=Pseudoalteromonas TaxID=53246 RepID=UPI00249A5476|nr:MULTISPECIES: MarR family transcriptional regulator [Pseudoalteromonas]MCP4060711.1 MarR family transcriptional regulator [Pseudoalteromonas sp.]MDI3246210.1 MarR family transcriptional regulator [Pseudoalteromonas agarivorans]WRU74816.1 MarR family transcriptional regulator [Pseudoalteromonas sp. CuT 4-3]